METKSREDILRKYVSSFSNEEINEELLNETCYRILLQYGDKKILKEIIEEFAISIDPYCPLNPGLIQDVIDKILDTNPGRVKERLALEVKKIAKEFTT